MSEITSIQWCDSTWNPWVGCTKLSPGCAQCYAEQSPPAKFGGIKWGGTPRISSDATFNAPLRWNKKPWVCEECGEACQPIYSASRDLVCPTCETMNNFHPRRVFALSLGDWLDPKVPDYWLARMIAIIHECQDLDFLLLTKRPELWKNRIEGAFPLIARELDPTGKIEHWLLDWMVHRSPPKNIWLGVSCEDQKRADERIPALLKIPAKIHFLSCEPLLGPIQITRICGLSFNRNPDHSPTKDGAGIDWVIVGGESGKNARPCCMDWVRGIKDQCRSAGVRCFVKQLGSDPRHDTIGTIIGDDKLPLKDRQVRIKSAPLPKPLKHPKGGDLSEWPEDLRVQEFPQL